MKKFYRFFLNALKFLCVGFILWFLAYFFFGERISMHFTDRRFASYFPQILVFLCAASIYGIFVLNMKNHYKKWVNILLFFGGFTLALIPFIAYHGFFQYQCGFWNQEIEKGKILYKTQLNSEEYIQVRKSKCKTGKNQISKDTLHIQAFTPYFEWVNDVKLVPSERSYWTIVK